MAAIPAQACRERCAGRRRNAAGRPGRYRHDAAHRPAQQPQEARPSAWREPWRLAGAGKVDDPQPVRRAGGHRRDDLVRGARPAGRVAVARALGKLHHPRRLRLAGQGWRQCRAHSPGALDLRPAVPLSSQVRRKRASLCGGRHRGAGPRHGLGRGIRPCRRAGPARRARLSERLRQRRHHAAFLQRNCADEKSGPPGWRAAFWCLFRLRASRFVRRPRAAR